MTMQTFQVLAFVGFAICYFEVVLTFEDRLRRLSILSPNRRSRGVSGNDVTSNVKNRVWKLGWEGDDRERCYETCNLKVLDNIKIQKTILDQIENHRTKLLIFKIALFNYTIDVLETYPYMASSYLASMWTLTLGEVGKKMLELPLDADVLSFYLINLQQPVVPLQVTSHPHHCMVSLSPKCRLLTVKNLIKSVIKSIEVFEMSVKFDILNPKYLCHYIMHNIKNVSRLSYKCCQLGAIGEYQFNCKIIFIDNNKDVHLLRNIIELLSFLITLYSPLVVLSVKSAFCFDDSTKFFRASLKHGITGQRNYVIRISYRQMINLNDPSPFSLPRAVFRLVCHCYGEGRCCIHCWGQWPHQPKLFSSASRVKKLWFCVLKLLGVFLIYPCAIHMALVLYFPKLDFYQTAIQHSHNQDYIFPIDLNLQTIGSYMTEFKDMFLSLWILFASLSFIYVTTLLSWSQYPLEKCLIKQKDKKIENGAKVLQNKFSKSYKEILFEMSYGQDSNNYKHFVKLPFFPFQVKRILRCIVRVCVAYIPILNTCSYLLQPSVHKSTQDLPLNNGKSKSNHSRFTNCIKKFLKLFLYFFVWTGFSLILLGYCSIVYIITEFVLNLLFFVFIATLIYPLSILPWLFSIISVLYYANDSLKKINSEHRFILKLIDENSPRLSAMEKNDIDEEVSTSRILKAHNLGAVKFVDSDGTEYVSKELYYKVSADLNCGFSKSARKFVREFFFTIIYFVLLFIVVKMVIFFSESIFCGVLFLTIGCLLPKLNSVKNDLEDESDKKSSRLKWSKSISDILDKHIRVDLLAGALDEGEEHLSTYDVRPVGVLEMELPKEVIFRTLQIWKFPWTVSCEQQTQTNEIFIHVLSARIASVSFVSRMMTKDMPSNLDSERNLRCWALLVENCIMEASARTSNLQGTPFIDTFSLFSTELQPLVSPFESGSSVDALVDSVNCELYGFCVLGVIACLNNVTCVIVKLESNRILAFNASSHGDHMPDFFGAVLITADFNAQNLQLIIKYLLEPNRPDSVPVYEELATEAVVIRSPEIYNVESNI